MRNFEYKTRCDDPRAAITKTRELGFDLWGDLRQTDTYFRVASGRLKLRETPGFQGELIFYRATNRHRSASATTKSPRRRTR